MNNLPVYQAQQTDEEIKTQYLFVSVGVKTIIKAIEYTPVMVIGTRTVYNLGFGDFDEALGTIIDDVNSNNGDMRIVFNTVLSTVPMFFSKNEEAVIIVSGSDSHEEFINHCLPNCKKKCVAHCKNFQRRIKTYRYYVDKNFEDLSVAYIFFGRNKSKANTFVQYIPNHHYDDILVYKKK
ncbi:hypothetical protein QWY90_03095 [Flavobacterium paronense]|uniref:DUF6934 family protein n=1 Tax=Flavobacterium paronense TaxID=1392775 RepID=A0ABV5GCN3_9FLAO|nr:hypothetical protein [Flavobacterium paronense]MDN3676293.1 hypothetical protein [Flavobacterium paronense]